MAARGGDGRLEAQIAEWWTSLLRRGAIHDLDVAEAEDRLRGGSSSP